MLIHEDYFKNIFNTVREAILILDENMRVLSANRSFFTIFKVDATNTVGSLLYDLGNGQWDIPHLRVLLEDILPKNDTVDDYEIEHNFESIGRKTMLLNACKIREKKDDLPIILLAVEDITEKKRLEDLLTESEERHRRLFETASDGILLLEKHEGHIVHANPASEKMLGYSEEECIGNNLQDIGVPLMTSDFPAIMQTLNKSGIINYNDVPVKTRSGQEIFTDIYMVDRAKLAQCNIRDVTERKRSNEKLKEEKTFIENALNAIKDVFFVFDLEGRFLRWNKTLNSVTGYLDREIALMKPVDLFRNDDIRRITKAIHTVAKEGSVNVEALIVTKDGRQIPYEFSGSLLSDAHGKSVGISGVGRDLTERRKAEVELELSDGRFKAIFENANDGILLADTETMKFFMGNEKIHQLLGYTENEIKNIGVMDIHPETDLPYVIEQFKKQERGEIKVVADIPVKRKDGSIFYADISSFHITFAGTKYLVGVFSDIAERKQAEEEHLKLEAQLRHSQKMEAVGSLAGGIAHDFNNILNVIMGYGNMVYDSIEAGSHAKEQMNEVLIAADKAATLTKRLLVFSRNNVLEVKSVNINALILGLQKMLDRIIRENIDFTLELTDRPLIVLADTGLIEQVLMNLAVNAKDAMQEGGRLTIGTGVEEMNDDYVAAYGYGKPGRYALITVSDTGHGIDAETQKKIFVPFFTTKGIGEGTGLGLAISYGIIKQHDGYINVYSEPGQGTVFKIYLPLTEGTTSPDMKTDAAFPVKGGNETILVTEDDASIRTLLRVVLESFGYCVITAEDGEDALEKFMENRDEIQLVLLDMIMPKKNGKEVSEAIRKVNPETKILFISGYTMNTIKTDEITEAGVDFIHKPFPPRDLLIKVREVLDR